MSIKMCCSTRRLSGATRYLISRIAYGALRSPGSNLALPQRPNEFGPTTRQRRQGFVGTNLFARAVTSHAAAE